MRERGVAAGAVGAGVLAGALATLVISSGGGSVRPWLAIAIAVTVMLAVAGTLAVARLLPTPVSGARRPERVRTDRAQGGTEQAARLLDKAMRDPGRFADALAPQLVELAAHRLRRRQGVDFRHDPDRARALLGDDLWQLMTAPRPIPPSYDQLADWMTRIEAL